MGSTIVVRKPMRATIRPSAQAPPAASAPPAPQARACTIDHRADGSILEEIRDKKELSDDLQQRLDDEIKKVLHGFNVEKEESLV